jgi:hypothetical protein
MSFAAGGDVDFAFPVTKDFDGLAGGGTEAEESDALSGLGPGDAEAAEADDAGAEEWGYVGVIEGGWEWVGEVGANEGVFGIATVDGVAGEGEIVAEVFFTANAEGAGAVGAADPGDANAHAGGGIGCGTVDDLADDLVAEDEGFVGEREVAFEDVEVGTADSAGEDLEEEMVRCERRDRKIFELKRLVGVQDGSFHLMGSSRRRRRRSPWMTLIRNDCGLVWKARIFPRDFRSFVARGK